MREHRLQASPTEGRTRARARNAGLWLGILFVAGQCAPVIKRDLSKVPVGQVGFDDMCNLQPYFDRLAMKIGTPPSVLNSIELQGKGHSSGRASFVFQTDFQLQAARQVLTQNWRRLPDDVNGATKIVLEVQWSERAGVRRVVTDRDAELTVGEDTVALPYHVCLSEFLFGEPLYKQRRDALGLGPLPTPAPLLGNADGGVTTRSAPAAANADAATTHDGGNGRAPSPDGGALSRPNSPSSTP